MGTFPGTLLPGFSAGDRVGKGAAFIPFVVAGDPSIGTTEAAIDALVSEGADLIEVGVPFSDALADGPVIQEASERAARTTSLTDVLAMVRRVRAKYPKLPLLLFTYYNPILRFGLDAFTAAASAAGVSGVLIVDLPPEESGGYRKKMAAVNLKTVFLASPTTSPERLPAITEASTGFLYYVSRTGVTGMQTSLSETLGAEIAELRKRTPLPIAIGFGISTGAQAKEVARIGDAVVVGSAFVKKIAEARDEGTAVAEVRTLAREIVGGFRK